MAENRDNRKRLSSDDKKGGLDALSPKKVKIPDKVNVPETQEDAVMATEIPKPDSAKPARVTVSDEVIDQIISETAQLRQEMAKEVFGDDVMDSSKGPKSSPKSSWQSRSVSAGKKDEDDSRKHTRKEYDERKGEHAEKKSPLKLIIILLVILVVGAAAFALIHFVIMPGIAQTEEAPTEAPPAPTAASVVPATVDEAEPTTPAATETEFEYAADAAVKKMSRREKICQLFMVTPEVLTDADLVTEAGDTTKAALENFPVGGILYSPRNFSGDEQAKKLIADTQSYSDVPLFIAVDDDGTVTRQEGADSTSQGNPQGGPQGGPEGGPQGGPGSGGPEGGPEGGPQGGPSNQSQDIELTPESAYDNALSVSQAKHDIGFNLDLSLVADVNDAIEGNDDEDITVNDICELVKSAVKGYTAGGVIPSVKYFPGQQTNDEEDDAESIPHLNRDLEAIEENELLPFRSGIGEGVKMIMVDHVIVDKLDDSKPATLSDKVVPQLLRGKLGFTGVTVSDNMSAEIITDQYSRSEIVKGIFAADIDVILNPDSMSKYITAIEDALDGGDITEEQLNTKVKRILALKYESGVIPEADE